MAWTPGNKIVGASSFLREGSFQQGIPTCKTDETMHTQPHNLLYTFTQQDTAGEATGRAPRLESRQSWTSLLTWSTSSSKALSLSKAFLQPLTLSLAIARAHVALCLFPFYLHGVFLFIKSLQWTFWYAMGTGYQSCIVQPQVDSNSVYVLCLCNRRVNILQFPPSPQGRGAGGGVGGEGGGIAQSYWGDLTTSQMPLLKFKGPCRLYMREDNVISHHVIISVSHR